MTSPLRPQSAEQFWETWWNGARKFHYENDQKALAIEFAEAYARAAAPQPESVSTEMRVWVLGKYENGDSLVYGVTADREKALAWETGDVGQYASPFTLEPARHVIKPVGESPAAAPQTRSIDGKFGFKDGKIVNLVSGQEIPEDEPLFLLRARDHHAISVLGTYYYHASKDCNDLHLAGIRQVIEKFEKFKTEHPERMKQPGITRHLKLDESSAAAPAAPLRPESK